MNLFIIICLALLSSMCVFLLLVLIGKMIEVFVEDETEHNINDAEKDSTTTEMMINNMHMNNIIRGGF